MDRRVQQAITLMKEKYLCTPLPPSWLDDLAQSLNLSPSRLRYLFKTETGLTPAQYLKHLKMEKAKELAESTNLRVNQILAMIEVGDGSHFLRDFKNAYGLTLSEYRNQFNLESEEEGEEQDIEK